MYPYIHHAYIHNYRKQRNTYTNILSLSSERLRKFMSNVLPCYVEFKGGVGKSEPLKDWYNMCNSPPHLHLLTRYAYIHEIKVRHKLVCLYLWSLCNANSHFINVCKLTLCLRRERKEQVRLFCFSLLLVKINVVVLGISFL